ncbi:Hypothetical protein GSB_151740, partial [Giardia duodenalis]
VPTFPDVRNVGDTCSVLSDQGQSTLPPADSTIPQGSISNPVALSLLKDTNDPAEAELTTTSLSDPGSTLSQLRLRISNRPMPLPLRSISPLSPSSSAVLLPSSPGAPTVDLCQSSLSLSASSNGTFRTHTTQDMRLSQLAELSLSLSQCQGSSQQLPLGATPLVPTPTDVSTTVPVVTASLPDTNTEDQPSQQQEIFEAVLRASSSSPRSLSTASASVASPNDALSDDDHLLVISPVRTYFVYEPRSAASMNVPFGQLVRRRLCSSYFLYWKMWHNTRKERLSTFQSNIGKKLMFKALSSIKSAYEEHCHARALLHWSWFKMQQTYTVTLRFRTCRALYDAFLLRKSFRGLRSKALLVATMSAQASLCHQQVVLQKCFRHGLIPAYRSLVAAFARAALHHRLLLYRIVLRNMSLKLRQLVAYEECCTSLRITYLVTVSFRSMISIHTILCKFSYRRSLALMRRSLDCWQYVFFKRLRVYASYDVVSTRTSKRYLSLAFSTWCEQRGISLIFRRWRKLYKARLLVRRYSGTSRFACLSADEVGYSCTYKGVHPRVETLFKGVFNHLRDRARLLLIKEKLVILLFKRRVFENMVLAYCKNTAPISERDQKDARHNISNEPSTKGALETDALDTDTPHLILLDAHKHVTNNEKGDLISDVLHTEFGVQVFSVDVHTESTRSVPAENGSFGKLRNVCEDNIATTRDCSVQAEPSYTSAELQRLSTTLTHSPTTVQQIIDKYRSQASNDVQFISKPTIKNALGQNEEGDDVYCITNIVSSPVRSPQRGHSPQQLPVLRQIHRLRPLQQLPSQFVIERHVGIRQQSNELVSASSSIEEISSIICEAQAAPEIASPGRSDNISVYSEIGSPFHFAREQSVSPIRTNPSEYFPLPQVPLASSDLNKECKDLLIEGHPSPSIKQRAPLSSEDPASDAFTGMQIISFTTGQLNESVVVPPPEYQDNAAVILGMEPHPVQSTEVGSYKMLDARYHLVSSFTEAVKKHLDATLLNHSSD